MKFYVFYRNPQTFRDSMFVTPDNIKLEDYVGITQRVEADDIEDLFRRMNVVDGSEVEVVGPGKLEIRSLSVGDVAIDETGRGYLCASFGWNDINTAGWTCQEEDSHAPTT